MRRRRGAPIALIAVLLVLGSLAAAAATLIGWVVSTAASAPPLASMELRDVGANTEILACGGTRLGFLQADDISQPVSGDRLPKVLKDATVAIEDERFFEHEGVDYEGIVRAAVTNFVSRDTVQGGSTITMQLVRNLYTGSTHGRGWRATSARSAKRSWPRSSRTSIPRSGSSTSISTRFPMGPREARRPSAHPRRHGSTSASPCGD